MNCSLLIFSLLSTNISANPNNFWYGKPRTALREISPEIQDRLQGTWGGIFSSETLEAIVLDINGLGTSYTNKVLVPDRTPDAKSLYKTAGYFSLKADERGVPQIFNFHAIDDDFVPNLLEKCRISFKNDQKTIILHLPSRQLVLYRLPN